MDDERTANISDETLNLLDIIRGANVFQRTFIRRKVESKILNEGLNDKR